MTTFLYQDTIVPADAGFPRWEDVYPDLPDPRKILFADGFTTVRANLANGVPDYATGAYTWSIGTSFAVTTTGGGFVKGNTSQNVVGLSQADGAARAIIEWGAAAGSISVVARLVDANNRIVFGASNTSGWALNKIVLGVTTAILPPVAHSFTIGDRHSICIKCVDSSIICTVDGEVIFDATETDLDASSLWGMTSTNANHAFHHFLVASA